ncbi:MAG: hypothetical protein HY986_02205 [Candidatus Melainabacteria bacterium]|nr:hypothetical protein [Candidatus Melainabacteria bacterium]
MSDDAADKLKKPARSQKVSWARAKVPYNGGITQELKAIRIDQSQPEEKRALAEQIEIMREQSKAIGTDTAVIDQFVKEELSKELSTGEATATGQPQTEVEKPDQKK